VRNDGNASAGASRTRYYLARGTTRAVGDVLLTGSRSIPALGLGATSTGTLTLTAPSIVPGGTYRLMACADDLTAVAESDEANNCLASTGVVTVGAPDLVVGALSTTATSVAPGGRLSVSHTVLNQGDASAAASRTRFYLSPDAVRGAGDILLVGTGSVTTLLPGKSGGSTVTLAVPAATALRNYYLLGCADDLGAVTERDESNNCRAASGLVTVTR
jgi:subtilase family serine protease